MEIRFTCGARQRIFKTIFVMLILLTVSQILSAQFLWKPVSESNGKLVVLFPSKYRQADVTSVYIQVNERQVRPSSTTQTGANGDRMHCRFPASGASYGNNLKVILKLKNGRTATWNIADGSKRTERIKETLTENDNGSNDGSNDGGMDDVLGGGNTSGSLISLDASNQGERDYECKEDCTLIVEPYLSTYGPAQLSVTIKSENGDDKSFIEWKRASDIDSSECIIDGNSDPKSISEVKSGDFSPNQGLQYKINAKKGDVITLKLSGEFGEASPFLKLKDLSQKGQGNNDENATTGDANNIEKGSVISLPISYDKTWELTLDGTFYSAPGAFPRYFHSGREAKRKGIEMWKTQSFRLGNRDIFFVRANVGSINNPGGQTDHWAVASKSFAGKHKVKIGYYPNINNCKIWLDGNLVGDWEIKIRKKPQVKVLTFPNFSGKVSLSNQ